MKKHGYHNTPTYSTWMCMRKRCNNPNAKDYHNYGGRGISVCESWNKSFECFLSDMGERPDAKTLDRVDVDGDYTKANCKWSSTIEQGRNTRANRLITLDGVTKCLQGWADEYSLKSITIAGRIKRGWSLEDAVKKPLRTRFVPSSQKIHEYQGRKDNIKSWCRTLNVDYACVHGRLRRGWTFKDAVEKPKNNN